MLKACPRLLCRKAKAESFIRAGGGGLRSFISDFSRFVSWFFFFVWFQNVSEFETKARIPFWIAFLLWLIAQGSAVARRFCRSVARLFFEIKKMDWCFIWGESRRFFFISDVIWSEFSKKPEKHWFWFWYAIGAAPFVLIWVVYPYPFDMSLCPCPFEICVGLPLPLPFWYMCRLTLALFFCESKSPGIRQFNLFKEQLVVFDNWKYNWIIFVDFFIFIDRHQFLVPVCLFGLCLDSLVPPSKIFFKSFANLKKFYRNLF